MGNNVIYGVLNHSGCHTDVSKTLRGAKNYATRHGYNRVSERTNCGYHVRMVAVKINGKWYNDGHWKFQEYLKGA